VSLWLNYKNQQISPGKTRIIRKQDSNMYLIQGYHNEKYWGAQILSMYKDNYELDTISIPIKIEDIHKVHII